MKNNSPTAALHTLGCKVNQYETQKISEELAARGFTIHRFSDIADVYIINTCTVTQAADSKSRQIIRSAISRNPKAYIIVTGCYAETSAEAIESIEGVTHIFRNSDKPKIAEAVKSLFPQNNLQNTHGKTAAAPARTRALIKIQDGCNQFCSYCAVPLARSVMWSKPFTDVIDEARRLADKGFKEIVLTGIRTGLYNDSANLTELAASLADIDGIERIRISSIESTDVPPDLLSLMSSNPKVCRHLHLPLQSGDNDVLRRMNRPYTAEQFLDFVQKAREIIPGIGITTDIIVGFPGETEQEFENTCDTAVKVQFSKAHIFRYSPRSGTAAYNMHDSVSPQEKERRSSLLSQITNASANRFMQALAGSDVNVLVESKKYNNGLYSGLTDTYVRVFFKESEYCGKIVKVHINEYANGRLIGVIS